VSVAGSNAGVRLHGSGPESFEVACCGLGGLGGLPVREDHFSVATPRPVSVLPAELSSSLSPTWFATDRRPVLVKPGVLDQDFLPRFPVGIRVTASRPWGSCHSGIHPGLSDGQFSRSSRDLIVPATGPSAAAVRRGRQVVPWRLRCGSRWSAGSTHATR
jgi:hypothetical protein